jgi:triacylglycerol lipase
VVGAEVIVTSVPGFVVFPLLCAKSSSLCRTRTGSITSRADRLHEQLKSRVRGRGINFLAHSMGGLDCRHLISHISPKEYVPLSLTTIGTPHRGSPFMDWCAVSSLI